MASQGQTYTRCTHLREVWFIVVCIVLNENFPECVNSVLFFFFFLFMVPMILGHFQAVGSSKGPRGPFSLRLLSGREDDTVHGQAGFGERPSTCWALNPGARVRLEAQPRHLRVTQPRAYVPWGC